jgi:ribosomal protein S4
MAKCKTYDYRHRVLLPVSPEGQLMPGTLEFAIHTLVEKRLDMAIFRGNTAMTRLAGPHMIPRYF